VDLDFSRPLRFLAITLAIALLSSAIGLLLGCSVGPSQIGLMFTVVLAPMIFFGCTYYPWSALETFPLLQKIVLINPVVYASEGLRSVLAPRFPHLPWPVILGALLLFDALFLAAGIFRFRKKAIG
jgi:ABC-2 type transport system permease protein